jgi:ABC-type glycerol-3-phosphate transport system substrate-binding protein
MTAYQQNGRASADSVSRRRFVQAVGASGTAIGLAGCTESDDSDDSTPTEDEAAGSQEVVLEWAASEQEADRSDEIHQALYDAGMPENISIEFLSGGNVTDDRRAQYQQWLSAGRSKPDLLRVDNGWTIPFIQRDSLLDLSDHLDQETLDRVDDTYFDMTVQTATGPQGNLFALPLWVGLPTMQYRKDLVEEAGYDPEGENWATESISWQKFSQVTADVLEQNPDIDYGYTFQADVYEGLSCCDFNEFMTSWGGAYFGGLDNLFGPVGDRPVTVDDQQVVDSIRMIRTFIHGSDDEHALDGYEGNIVPEAVLQWTEESSRGPFTDGNAVMHRNWPYAVNVNGSEENFGEDLGVMPIPYATAESEAPYEGTGGPVAALGGWHLAVNPNSENVEAALEVIEAASKDSFNLEIFDVLGQIPPKPAVLEQDRAQQVPVMGRYLDAIQVAGENAIPRPVTVVWPDQSSKISREVNAAYSQDKSPEQAMADLKESLTAIENST